MMKTKQTRTQVPANVDRVIAYGEVKQVMTKSLEQEIVENAPCESWDHTEKLASTRFYYLRKLKSGLGYETWLQDGWERITVTGNIRSRKDIEQIIALQNENAEKDKMIAELAKDNRHSVINFVDFCIEREGLNRQGMEIAYMHFIKSKGGAE